MTPQAQALTADERAKLQTDMDRLDDEQLDRVIEFLALDLGDGNEDIHFDLENLPIPKQRSLIAFVAAELEAEAAAAGAAAAAAESGVTHGVSAGNQSSAAALLAAPPLPVAATVVSPVPVAVAPALPVAPQLPAASARMAAAAVASKLVPIPTDGMDSMLGSSAEVLSMLDSF